MARTFDGVDDRGSATMNAEVTTAWTFGMWVKCATGGSSFGRLATLRSTADEQVALFSDGAVGKIKVLMRNTAGTLLYGPTPATMATGVWYFYTARWASGGGINTRIYNADGTVFSDVNGGAITATLVDQAGGTTHLGYSGNGSYWAGSLDRPYWHNSRLNDAQLDALVFAATAAELPIPPSGDWWDMPGGDTDMRETGEVHGTVMDFVGAASTSSDGIASSVVTVAPLRGADFTDDFPGTTIDTTKWSLATSAGSVNDELIVKQLDYYPGAFSVPRVDMLDSHLQVAVTPDMNVSGSREDGVEVRQDSNNRVLFIHTGANIFGQVRVAGSNTQTNTIAYDPVQHKYRRVRYVGGQGWYFDVAPSANGEWTTLNLNAPMDVPWNVRDCEVVLWAGFWQAGETTDKVVRFDKLNIMLASKVLTGSTTPAGLDIAHVSQRRTGRVDLAGSTLYERLVTRLHTASVSLGGLAQMEGRQQTGGSLRPQATRWPMRMMVSRGGSIRPTGEADNTLGMTKGGTIPLAGSRVTNYLGRIFGQAGIVVLTVVARGRVRLRARRPN